MYNSIVLPEDAYKHAREMGLVPDVEGLTVKIVQPGEKPNGEFADPYDSTDGHDRAKYACVEVGLEGEAMDKFYPKLSKGSLPKRLGKWLGRHKGAVTLGVITAGVLGYEFLTNDFQLMHTVTEQVTQPGGIIYNDCINPDTGVITPVPLQITQDVVKQHLNPEMLYAGLTGLLTALSATYSSIVNRADYKEAKRAYKSLANLEDYFNDDGNQATAQSNKRVAPKKVRKPGQP